MNYAESLEYLYHAKQAGARKNGLVNMLELTKRLGNPEVCFPCVHVAGTNGKGSVCAFIESIARAAGYRTGLFTSPYLERFTERIRVCGQEIARDEFALLATQVRSAVDGMARDGLGIPTFFEMVTACGFLHFASKKIDIAIVEAGLGGLTDATNVLRPALSVITTIGMDHSHVLGGTVEEIAHQKAGIIKPDIPCVLSGMNSAQAALVIRQAAERAGGRLVSAGDCHTELAADGLDGQVFHLVGDGFRLDGLQIGLSGAHQTANAATAVLAARELGVRWGRINETSIRHGLIEARWPGRMELLRRDPPFIIDGAHNPQGAEALAAAVLRYLPSRPVCLVTGMMAEKDTDAIVAHLSAFAAQAIVTLPPESGRLRRNAAELADSFKKGSIPAVVREDWRMALEDACGSGMVVVVAGSLYLAGAARTWWLSTHCNGFNLNSRCSPAVSHPECDCQH